MKTKGSSESEQLIVFIADHIDISACHPKYSFRMLDIRDLNQTTFHYQHVAGYYSPTLRTLWNEIGILFVIDVQGRAGKFDWLKTSLSFGAFVGLFAATSWICDIIISTFLLKDFDEQKYDVRCTTRYINAAGSGDYVRPGGHQDIEEGKGSNHVEGTAIPLRRNI